jgi:ferredoxin
MLPVAPASEKRPERPAPVLEEGSAAPAALREKATEAIRSGRAVLALSASSMGPIPALFRTEAELEAMVSGVKYPLGRLAGLMLRDRRKGAVDGTDHLVLRAAALACEAPLAVVCRSCDARALNEQAALNQFPAESLSLIAEACSEERIAACGCERPEWPGEAPAEAAPALPADLAANAARWEKEFSRCVQCHWCRTACPVCVCPTCSLDGCAVLPAGMMPPSPLGYHLARAMHVADTCVQCGACQDVCPQGAWPRDAWLRDAWRQDDRQRCARFPDARSRDVRLNACYPKQGDSRSALRPR